MSGYMTFWSPVNADKLPSCMKRADVLCPEVRCGKSTGYKVEWKIIVVFREDSNSHLCRRMWLRKNDCKLMEAHSESGVCYNQCFGQD